MVRFAGALTATVAMAAPGKPYLFVPGTAFMKPSKSTRNDRTKTVRRDMPDHRDIKGCLAGRILRVDLTHRKIWTEDSRAYAAETLVFIFLGFGLFAF